MLADREERLRRSDFRAADYGERELADGVGRGWHPIVLLLNRRLLALDPDYRLYEVGERHGLLRVRGRFVSEHTAECRELVARAVGRSSRTCEVCGANARVRDERLRIKTLCDACSNADRATAADRGERYADLVLTCMASSDPAFPDADELVAWLEQDDTS